MPRTKEKPKLFRVAKGCTLTDSDGERRPRHRGEEVELLSFKTLETMIRTGYLIPLAPEQFGLDRSEARKPEDIPSAARTKRRRGRRRKTNGE